MRPNEGQIEGVPANPRQIMESEFKALCKSMREDNLTGVLQMKVYNHAGEWVVLDGNMRLRALQEIGLESVQCLNVPTFEEEKLDGMFNKGEEGANLKTKDVISIQIPASLFDMKDALLLDLKELLKGYAGAKIL